MCGSTAFGSPLSGLGENPETFMVKSYGRAALDIVQPQSEENVLSSSPSPGPQPIDSTPAFNLMIFVKDFGVSASQEPTEDTPAIQTCTEDQNFCLTEQLGDPHLAL